MRIIGHVSENNRNHFQAVWNRITQFGKKLSIIASGLVRLKGWLEAQTCIAKHDCKGAKLIFLCASVAVRNLYTWEQ